MQIPGFTLTLPNVEASFAGAHSSDSEMEQLTDSVGFCDFVLLL